MSISRYIAFAIIAIGAIWGIVGFASTLEAAHSYYARRGAIMRWVGTIVLSRWFSVAVFLSGIAFLYVLERGVPTWLWNRRLEMTVTSYRYSTETRELIASVQFVNNGPTRRIVLGAMFTYKPPEIERDRNTVHYIGLEELRSRDDDQTPIYVEPGQPILATFRRKVLVDTPLKTPGTIFGLEVQSLTASGGNNVTWVDIMEVLGPDPAIPGYTGGFVTGRRATISLDEMARHNPMETQSQLRSKWAPPPSASSPATSPAAALTASNSGGSPEETPSPSKRIADVTPQELYYLVQRRTPLEAAKLMESYKGLWIETEGEMMESPLPHGLGCVVTLRPPPFNGFQTECRFLSQWCKELDGLKEKQVIRVRGKIGHHFLLTLALEECELISPRRQFR